MIRAAISNGRPPVASETARPAARPSAGVLAVTKAVAWALFAAALHAQNAQPLRLNGAVLTRACTTNNVDIKADRAR